MRPARAFAGVRPSQQANCPRAAKRVDVSHGRHPAVAVRSPTPECAINRWMTASSSAIGLEGRPQSARSAPPYTDFLDEERSTFSVVRMGA